MGLLYGKAVNMPFTPSPAKTHWPTKSLTKGHAATHGSPAKTGKTSSKVLSCMTPHLAASRQSRRDNAKYMEIKSQAGTAFLRADALAGRADRVNRLLHADSTIN